jgi:hypothetical protein
MTEGTDDKPAVALVQLTFQILAPSAAAYALGAAGLNEG